MLCSAEMQKRDSKNLPLSYYIFVPVNNSQLDAKSIGKSLVGAKPIWQKPSVVKGWAVSTIVISHCTLGGPGVGWGGWWGVLFKCPFKVHHITL